MTSWGGAWTDTKKRVVKEYLDAYQRALKNMPFEKWYIDAFAGIGTHPGRESEDAPLPFEFYDKDERAMNEDYEFRSKGSPLLALKADPPFDRYFFIEKEKSRREALAAAIQEHGYEERANIVAGDANEVLIRFCQNLTRRANVRVVIFLDPFGMNVSWECLSALARIPRFDVWYLFPIMGAKRMLPRDGLIPDSWARRLDTVLGDSDWRESLYIKDSAAQLVLFNDEPALPGIGRSPASEEGIERYVTHRMKRIFPYVADEPLSLYNSRGKHIFSLFFAISNPNDKAIGLAKRISKHIIEANRE